MLKTKKSTIVLLVILFGLTAAWYVIKSIMIQHFLSSRTSAPVSVASALVSTSTFNPSIKAIGSTKAMNGVDVTSDVAGRVTAILFRSGQSVVKGQALVQLDASIDEEAVKQQTALATLARSDYRRQLALSRRKATSKSALESARVKMQQANSQLRSDEIMLSKKTIRAPFTGVVGIRNISVGEYLSPGKAIVSLQSVRPMMVDFNLPESDIPKLKIGMPMKVSLSSGNGKQYSGHLSAIGASVQVATRTIPLRGVIKASATRLIPGQFVRVNVMLPTLRHVMVIPTTAVSYSLYGDSVFVISSQPDKSGHKTVTQRFVTLGPEHGQLVTVVSGLKLGESVVSAGALKLRNGSHVVIETASTTEQKS